MLALIHYTATWFVIGWLLVRAVQYMFSKDSEPRARLRDMCLIMRPFCVIGVGYNIFYTIVLFKNTDILVYNWITIGVQLYMLWMDYKDDDGDGGPWDRLKNKMKLPQLLPQGT